jgi:pimeloyl-ACP methyl ester carboxylesterase
MTTLYLLPGLMCDETVWSEVAGSLRGGAEVWTPGLFDFDNLQDMALAVLAVAPERFAVAGHSMGGRVALEILALAPHRVERIALLDTGAHLPAAAETESRQRLVDLGVREGMQAVCDAWLPPMLHPSRIDDVQLVEPLAAMVGRCPPEVLRRQQTALLNRPDGNTRLPLVTMPCALIVGRQDRWSPPAQHEAIRERVPHATLTLVEDCGHMAPCERPTEVAAALAAWLAA